MSKSVFLYVLSFLLLFSSCEKEEPAEKKGIKIGISASQEIFLQERWDRDIKIFTKTAGELGGEVILAKSPTRPGDQVSQIEFLLEENIDVLVVIPEDKVMLGGIIKKIMNRDIPVLAYDRPVMEVPVSAYISFDNRRVGQLMAIALIKEVPVGNYLIVNGSYHDNNSFSVNRGVHDVLDRAASEERINILEEIWLEEWSYDEALIKIREVFDKNPDIDAVSAANDHIAQAAIRVLAERRMAGEVAVTGQDADLASCQAIVEGKQLMTVYKPIHKLAERAARLAVQAASGDLPEPERYLDNSSGIRIPFYVENPVAVNKSNIDETVINDGFHSYSDVYRDE